MNKSLRNLPDDVVWHVYKLNPERSERINQTKKYCASACKTIDLQIERQAKQSAPSYYVMNPLHDEDGTAIEWIHRFRETELKPIQKSMNNLFTKLVDDEIEFADYKELSDLVDATKGYFDSTKNVYFSVTYANPLYQALFRTLKALHEHIKYDLTVKNVVKEDGYCKSCEACKRNNQATTKGIEQNQKAPSLHKSHKRRRLWDEASVKVTQLA